MRDYFPSGRRGAVLTTSRISGARRLRIVGEPIDLNKMTETECLDLLIHASGRESLGNVDMAIGKSIVSRVGYVAMAIDLPGGYISENHLEPGLFIQNFDTFKEELPRETPEFWEYKRILDEAEVATAVSIFTAWEISFRQIKGD